MTDRNQELLRRSLVNLQALRTNMPVGYISQIRDAHLFKVFNQALDDLQLAGVNVSEWRLPHNVREIDSSEFNTRLDAVLGYFTLQEVKNPIGFQR